MIHDRGYNVPVYKIKGSFTFYFKFNPVWGLLLDKILLIKGVKFDSEIMPSSCLERQILLKTSGQACVHIQHFSIELKKMVYTG